MVDQEVQNILQEIRERVRGGAVAELDNTPAPPEPQQLQPDPGIDNRFAGLSTMDRAWDRLPPLVSNRNGSTARLELWIKSHIKRALRWITWEQVNFNAAVHHTLRETVESLINYEQRLRQYEQRLRQQEQLSANVDTKPFDSFRHEVMALVNANNNDSRLLRTELLAEIHHRREESVAQQQEFNSIRTEMSAHRREITDIAETQLLELVARYEGLQTQRHEVAAKLDALQTNLAAMENQNQERLDSVSEQLTAFEASRQQTQSRLSDLLAELRERDDRLLEEQRVCFKQLSLEASEAAVLKDRVYRDLAERINKLETGSSSATLR
jgi:DNA repair exonuclease SbcCD ATPase subunit